MIKEVSKNEFVEDLLNDDYASFSYTGAGALYEYLTDIEENTGQLLKFDRVAIRCDFSEYDNLEDILSQYDNINTLEELEENTIVIEFRILDRHRQGYIIQDF